MSKLKILGFGISAQVKYLGELVEVFIISWFKAVFLVALISKKL